MGQQQLLLVILVTIIVGIATVVAINIFGVAAEEANRDAVRQDLMAASAQAQAVWARPAMMNGAGQDFTTLDADVLIRRLGIPGNAATDEAGTETGDLENENGTYSISRTASQVVLTGSPATGDPDIIATVTHSADGWDVTILDDTN